MIRVSLTDRYKSATQVLNALGLSLYRAKLRDYVATKQSLNRTRIFAPDPDAPLPPYYPPAVRWAIALSQK